MTITERVTEAVTATVAKAAWGWITPEVAAREIMEILNPTLWPRCTPGYGTTGTRRSRRRTSNDDQ